MLEAVASLDIESVRELVGALNRLVAFQAVSEVPLDAAQARAAHRRAAAGGETDELVVEQAETMEFAVAGHAEMVHAGRCPPRACRRAPGRDAGSVGHAGRRAGGRAARRTTSDGRRRRITISASRTSRTSTTTRTNSASRADTGEPPDQLGEGLAEKPALQADRDEFGDFLSDLAATLARQVDPWRARVGEAILRWEGEGFRTYRLERLLDDPEPPDPESVMIQYEADAEQLLELRAEAESLAPEMAGAAQLTDPGNMAAAEAYMQRVREGAVPPAGPVEHWLLDDLIEGPGNRMAVRAAQAAIAEPGSKYNPIVVVGGSGVGKTHLLHGIGNALALASDGHVACLSAHDFTQELIDAIDRDAVTAWRNRYRRCSALLLDDVHLIAGKERTQEELFLLFNLFLESNRQLGLRLGGAAGRTVGRGAAPADAARGRAGGRIAAARPRAAPAAGGADAGGTGPGSGCRAGHLHRVASRRVGARGAGLRAARPALRRFAADEGDARPLRARCWRAAPRVVRKSSVPGRSVSVSVASSGGVKSREKTVWSWPTLSERVIEEWK